MILSEIFVRFDENYIYCSLEPLKEKISQKVGLLISLGMLM